MAIRTRRPADRLIEELSLPLGAALLVLLVAWHGRQLLGFWSLGISDFRILRDATAEASSGSLYTLRTAHGNLNPPHFHLLMFPFTFLPPNVAWMLWTVLNVLGLALSLRLIVRELGATLSVLQWTWLVNAALIFAGTAAALWSGQTSLLLMWPATLAWQAARRDRWTQSGALTGLLLAVKPFMLLLAPYWFLNDRRRPALTAAALVCLCALGVGLATFGIAEYRAWLRTLGTVNWADEPWNGSLLAPIARISRGARYDWLDRAWMGGAALIAFASVARVAPNGRHLSVDRGLACVLVGALLASPLGWVHYLWWGAGPIAAAILEDGWRVLGGWRAAISVVATAGLISPPAIVGLWHTHGWGRVTFGSAYFWGTLALWVLLMAPARPTRA